MDHLNSHSFQSCLDSEFNVVTGAEPLVLRLIDVTERSDQPNLEHFALTFAGPGSPWLPQQTCTLQHPTLGEMAIFLVPLGPDADGMRYEAVFNRLKDSSPA